jgi:SAM-dependent methyltransferase
VSTVAKGERMAAAQVPRLKMQFKACAPNLYSVCSVARIRTLQLLHDCFFGAQKSRFREIYQTRFWAPDGESASGPGSSLAQTQVIRSAIPNIIKRHGINSVLDVPCGDFWWARHMELGPCRYFGADLVEEIVLYNSRNYSAPLREFLVLDLTRDHLLKVDMILCRDCLPHLSFKNIKKALANIKASGSKYLLTTTFPDHRSNTDAITGGFRPLNLHAAPFNFPEQLCLVNEGCGLKGGTEKDKSLALWSVNELPV